MLLYVNVAFLHYNMSTAPRSLARGAVHLGDSEKTLRHITQSTSHEKTSFQSPIYPDKHKIIKNIFIYQKIFRQKKCAYNILKYEITDFHGGPVVKKSACKCRVYECHPWSGKIPHVVHEATKPMCHNSWAHMQQLLKPVHPRACTPQEANAIRNPHTAARE